MSTLETATYKAFKAAGVPETEALAAAEALNKQKVDASALQIELRNLKLQFDSLSRGLHEVKVSQLYLEKKLPKEVKNDLQDGFERVLVSFDSSMLKHREEVRKFLLDLKDIQHTIQVDVAVLKWGMALLTTLVIALVAKDFIK